MEIKCDTCGILFDKKPSHILKSKRHYCSRKCQSIGYLGQKQEGQFEIAYKHINEDGLLLCTNCKKYLDKDMFFYKKNIKHRFDRSYNCKECESIVKKNHHELTKNDRNEILSTVDGYLINLIKNAKCRKKSTELGNDITFEYLKDMYIRQNGCCNICGDKMTTIVGEGYVRSNISIDRIDSSIGYIKGNIQLVCRIINTMKLTLTMEELRDYCNKIVKNLENGKNILTISN